MSNCPNKNFPKQKGGKEVLIRILSFKSCAQVKILSFFLSKGSKRNRKKTRIAIFLVETLTFFSSVLHICVALDIAAVKLNLSG